MILKVTDVLHCPRTDAKFWLCEELMQSLNSDIISDAVQAANKPDEATYDVKLLVNGVELDPMVLTALLTKIEKFVDYNAETIANQKLSGALAEVHAIGDLLKAAEEKIRDKYNIFGE